LISFLKIFGPVEEIEVVSNLHGSKGFGFLTFLRRRDGERAMLMKNGTIADGRKITVRQTIVFSLLNPSGSSRFH
jgi:RNA recognition motif-containing protein